MESRERLVKKLRTTNGDMEKYNQSASVAVAHQPGNAAG